ncbi:MAG: riboflavin biosynthesis protein RibF, partial [Rhodothermales bacterium]
EEDVPLLTTIEERADAMEDLGIDRFIVIPFTTEFSKLQAEDFVRSILVDRIGLREIVIGYDHAFGRDRRGDAELLAVLGREHGFTVDVIPPQVVRQHVVSSSELRHIIAAEGDVKLAAQMLGRPYSFRGTVLRGEGRGRGIGFPTANLRPDHPKKVIPAVGVYAVRVRHGSEIHPGMMNIGHRPTFGEGRLALEVHLLDFDEDLYGRDLRVEFVARMRDERKFESREALTQQLSKDRARCIDLLGG